MNLLELIGVKRFKDSKRPEVASFLHHLTPFRKAGEGAFANVFKRGNKIYKFWMVDKEYDRFIRYVIKHQGNLSLPHILSGGIKTLPVFFKKHEKMGDKIYYVVMEELQKVRQHDKFELYEGDPGTELKQWLDYISHDDVRLSMLQSDNLTDNARSFFETAGKLDELGLLSDLHSGNIMKRASDGWLVFTDPSADAEDLLLNKEFAKFDVDWEEDGDDVTKDVKS